MVTNPVFIKEDVGVGGIHNAICADLIIYLHLSVYYLINNLILKK